MCYKARTKIPKTNARFLQKIAYTNIGTTPDTPRNTASVMGNKLNNGKRRSAREHARKEVPYNGDPQNNEEWCHLLAASLGGATVPKNLVAASYSANTFMLVIESLIRGNSNVQVEVEAHCSRQHVAEWIVYKVRSKKDRRSNIQFNIDAKCTDFTATDGSIVGNYMGYWLSGIEE
ncbi:hypothetical protein F0U61_20145 [Archangium violaceum]|uniref:hypothetical protein n=1 Tax=Archangium violaceum TaxID=83451 RepID=UPI002B2F3476|nr:hypothetical protein F0U61_20145 [Archangium violaceum]